MVSNGGTCICPLWRWTTAHTSFHGTKWPSFHWTQSNIFILNTSTLGMHWHQLVLCSTEVEKQIIKISNTSPNIPQTEVNQHITSQVPQQDQNQFSQFSPQCSLLRPSFSCPYPPMTIFSWKSFRYIPSLIISFTVLKWTKISRPCTQTQNSEM